jgi:hypothetical protein
MNTVSISDEDEEDSSAPGWCSRTAGSMEGFGLCGE